MRLILTLLLTMAMNCATQADDTITPAPSTEAATAREAPNPSKPDGLRFEDFPAKVFQTKPAKNIRIHPNDSWARESRTHILEAMRRGADFGGHYSVVLVGCGTACLATRLVDLRTGELFKAPGGYSLDLDYSVKSRLMKVAWMDGLICVNQDFEWTGRRFEKRHEEREKLDDETDDCLVWRTDDQ